MQIGEQNYPYKNVTDDVFGLPTVIQSEHAEIHEGDSFYVKDWTSIAGSTTIYFLIVTPNTTYVPHMTIFFSFQAEANITVSEGTVTSNNGTPLSTFNRFRDSTNVSTTLLYTAPTVTSVGTTIARYKAGSGKSTGVESNSRSELMLKKNTKYLVAVQNDTVSNNWCDYLADWYEHISLN